MSATYMQTIAQVTLAIGLLCGIALGYFAAAVLELYLPRRRRTP